MLAELIDKKEFFRKQTEECQQLARNAVSEEDHVFWEKAAKHWKKNLRRSSSPKRLVAGAGKSEDRVRQSGQLGSQADRSKVTLASRARKKDEGQIAAQPRSWPIRALARLFVRAV
jgi:hypothetical protein